MKDKILYDNKNDCIWLAMKDDRNLINGKWKQRWWVYNGEMSFRPATNEEAFRKTKTMVELEASRYLDEYR